MLVLFKESQKLTSHLITCPHLHKKRIPDKEEKSKNASRIRLPPLRSLHAVVIILYE